MQSQPNRLSTLKEAASALNVSLFGLYRKIGSSDLPSFRFGRKVLVDIAELRAFMRRPAKDEKSEVSQ